MGSRSARLWFLVFAYPAILMVTACAPAQAQASARAAPSPAATSARTRTQSDVASFVPPPASDDATVLVRARVPLTQAIVDNNVAYFSWLLQAAIPHDLRAAMQEAIVADWRSNNRQEMQGALTYAVAYVKIAQLDPQAQATARERLLPQTLSAFRASADPIASRLLAAYEASHSSASARERRPAAAATSPAPTGNPSALSAGKGRFDGLYRAVVQVVDYHGAPQAGIKYDYVVFLPDGGFKEGIAEQGLDGLNEAAEIRRDPVGWGAYEMNGSVGRIVFPPTEYSREAIVWPIREYPDRLLVNGNEYHLLDKCDDLRLQGTFRRADYKTTYGARQGIAFTPDGRFVDEGAFKAAGVMVRNRSGGDDFDDGAPGNGTYRIANYTLELTYSNGRVKRTSFYIEPGTPKTGVREFYLNTWRFARVQ